MLIVISLVILPPIYVDAGNHRELRRFLQAFLLQALDHPAAATNERAA